MTCGALLTETLSPTVDYLITNTPDSGTAKNKKAIELGIKRITEAQFNEMIGRITYKKPFIKGRTVIRSAFFVSSHCV